MTTTPPVNSFLTTTTLPTAAPAAKSASTPEICSPLTPCGWQPPVSKTGQHIASSDPKNPPPPPEKPPQAPNTPLINEGLKKELWQAEKSAGPERLKLINLQLQQSAAQKSGNTQKDQELTDKIRAQQTVVNKANGKVDAVLNKLEEHQKGPRLFRP